MVLWPTGRKVRYWMKAERKQVELKFVPVIVTLESQEEVDALYAVIDNTIVVSAIPVLQGWQVKLQDFRSNAYESLFKNLDKLF